MFTFFLLPSKPKHHTGITEIMATLADVQSSISALINSNNALVAKVNDLKAQLAAVSASPADLDGLVTAINAITESDNAAAA